MEQQNSTMYVPKSKATTKKLRKTDHDKRILYNTREAAVVCCVSQRTWRIWHLMGFVPTPIKIGRSLFWRVDEIKQWIDEGCPIRDEWIYRPGKKFPENSSK